jgi:hypothetical protein
LPVAVQWRLGVSFELLRNLWLPATTERRLGQATRLVEMMCLRLQV